MMGVVGMRRIGFMVMLGLLADIACAQMVRPAPMGKPWEKGETEEAGEAAGTGGDEKFPDKKWFQNGKGFNEALEIQKTTGADIFVYFARYHPADEKGLCTWFERRGLVHPDVEKLLRGYIKVKFTYPLGKADEEPSSRFKVEKCPAVFVVGTRGFPSRVPVFNWLPGGPELLKSDEMVEGIRSRSSERYKSGVAPAAPPAAETGQP